MPEPILIALNKPMGVLCQFTRDGDRPTLADFIKTKDVYPAGRLDTDSEGLMLLTDHGALQHRISHPRLKLAKTYLAQVEGEAIEGALARLKQGVDLGDFKTAPCHATAVDEPAWLWPRTPPIRVRVSIPTSWIEITITEGKNRQVRRMTAAVGLPTLRLIRTRIGPYELGGLTPGASRQEDARLLDKNNNVIKTQKPFGSRQPTQKPAR